MSNKNEKQVIGISGIKSEERLMGSSNNKNNDNNINNINNKNLMKDAIDILEKGIPQRHSFFQLRYFVIGKEPTNQSKMWQCLREIKARKETLEAIILESEEQKDTLESLKIEKRVLEMTDIKEERKELKDLLEKEKNIKINKKNRKIKALISDLAELLHKKKYIEEELDFFIEMFKSIENLEPLLPFDDVSAQKQYWTERLTQKLNLKVLSGVNIDNELMETIVALPDDMEIKKQVMNTLTLRRNQIIKKLEEQGK